MTTSAISMAETDIRFQQVSRDDGLSQSFVLSVTQDSEGYIWFGTQSGLNRYDGYEMRVFENTNQPGDLPDNVVRNLYSDSKGRLWASTDNGGLALYLPESESFRVFDSTNSRLPTDRIRFVAEDRLGRLLVGTDGAGLWRLVEDETDFVNHLGNLSLPNGSIWHVADQGRDLLIATKQGLFKLNENGTLVQAYEGTALGEALGDAHIRAVLVDGQNQTWIGTESQGLFRVVTPDEFERFTQTPDGLSGRQVFRLLEDDHGDIWVATSNGLNRFVDGELKTYANRPQDSWSLSNNMVFDLHQDQSGVIWFATYRGVSFWPRSEYLAEHFYSASDSPGELNSNFIAAFAETADGDIWIGTITGGLNRLSLDGSFEAFNRRSPVALPDDDVMSLLVDSRDRLWVGTRTAGLLIFEKAQGVVQRFTSTSPAPYRLSADAITSISESDFGQILVSTYGGGFNLIDIADLTVSQFKAGSGPTALPSNRIMSIMEDSTGVIWLGTDGSGLVLYDRHRGEFRQFHNGAGGFTSDLVLTINEDLSGNVWFGSIDKGAFVLRREERSVDTYEFQNFSQDIGLPGNSIYGIQTDDQGRVWLSSNSGLSRIENLSTPIRTLGLRNGLQDLEFNTGASLKLSNGDLLFGGVNGFNRVNPSLVENNTAAPKIVITEVSRQSQTLLVPEVFRDGVVLNYRDFFLEFKFAGLDFTHVSDNRYRYRLVGLQDAWVEAGERRYASYNNLSPGNYMFEVQAANGDGVWSTESAQVKVIVNPAPWLSGWAYLLYALVFSAAVALAYRVNRSKQQYVNQVQLVNEKLSQEVVERIRTEQEMRHELERSQRYIDVAEVMLVALDVEGVILNVNEKTSSLLGSPEDDLVGSNLLDFVTIKDRNDLREKVLAVFDAEDNGEHFECQVKDGNDALHTVIWRFSPLSEAGGHARLLLASGTDITELRQLERAFRFKEKLSALGTLSAGIAHDFNNILTAITGYNDLALDKVGKGTEVESFLRKVEQASNRATDLVARILSVTQVDEDRMAAVDVVATIKESVKLLHGTLPSKIEIVESYPRQEIVVQADAAQLHQLIVNLGSNAANAMSANGGRLDITLEKSHLDASTVPRGSTLSPGEYVVIHVRDTGMGMPEAMKQKIFDPFYSSEDLGGDRAGTGLGLSIVHGIVLNHKGHIEVDSHLGMGTHFSIYMPCIAIQADDRVIPLPTPKSRTSRVMLVDDEEWIVDVASRLLSSMGLEVEAFLHPVEALERFKSAAGEFDLVITDQNMPNLKGTELVESIRSIRGDVKMVLMSGNVSPLPEGSDVHFMAKPFRVADLRDALKTVGIQNERSADSSA